MHPTMLTEDLGLEKGLSLAVKRVIFLVPSSTWFPSTVLSSHHCGVSEGSNILPREGSMFNLFCGQGHAVGRTGHGWHDAVAAQIEEACAKGGGWPLRMRRWLRRAARGGSPSDRQTASLPLSCCMSILASFTPSPRLIRKRSTCGVKRAPRTLCTHKAGLKKALSALNT